MSHPACGGGFGKNILLQNYNYLAFCFFKVLELNVVWCKATSVCGGNPVRIELFSSSSSTIIISWLTLYMLLIVYYTKWKLFCYQYYILCAWYHNKIFVSAIALKCFNLANKVISSSIFLLSHKYRLYLHSL